MEAARPAGMHGACLVSPHLLVARDVRERFERCVDPGCKFIQEEVGMSGKRAVLFVCFLFLFLSGWASQTAAFARPQLRNNVENVVAVSRDMAFSVVIKGRIPAGYHVTSLDEPERIVVYLPDTALFAPGVPSVPENPAV